MMILNILDDTIAELKLIGELLDPKQPERLPVVTTLDRALRVSIPGYGNAGVPIVVELYDGRATVHIWADGKSDPISFDLVRSVE